MADGSDVNIGGKSISSLRVVDLKKECDKRGLSKSGTKTQLVERLKTQLLLECLGTGEGAAASGLREDECQNEFIKQYLAQQKELIENVESSMNSSSQDSDADESPNKRKSVNQSPPIRSSPVEISPEKLCLVSEISGTVFSNNNAEGKPSPEAETVTHTDRSHPSRSEDPSAMRRSRKKISRIEPESKSQNDLPKDETSERRGRNKRQSVSSEHDKDGADSAPAPESASTAHSLVESRHGDQATGTVGKSKPTEKAEKSENKIGDKMEVGKDDSTVAKISHRSSKSHSRSPSRTPSPSSKKNKRPIQVQSSTKARARSTSSSSSHSSSRKKHWKSRSVSRSSSSSRSRSRTPEKTKKTIPRKKTWKAERSSSSSRSRSPSPKIVKQRPEARAPEEIVQKSKSSLKEVSQTMKIKQRSASRSSSSRSRSCSPVQQINGKTTQHKATVDEPVQTTTTKLESADKRIQSVSRELPELAVHFLQKIDMEDLDIGIFPIQHPMGIEAVKDVTHKQQAELKPTKKIFLNRRTIEDAGKAQEETGDREIPEGREKQVEEKPAKKRKWGSRTTSASQKTKRTSSIPISTESLKNLIPDMKPSLKLAPEPVMEDEMDYEDDATTMEQIIPEQEDTRSVKIQRTVIQDVKKNEASGDGDSVSEGEEGAPEEEKQQSNSEDDSEREEEKREIKKKIATEEEEPMEIKVESIDKEEEPTIKKTITVTTKVKKEKRDRKKEIKLVRRLDSGVSTLVKPDEPIAARRSPSPARNPPSKIVHIRNLVRPFTINQLKELLRRNGNLHDDLFWIDKIKSHCFAVYDNEDEAIETRKVLHNTTWPLSNPKTLIVDFGSQEQMDYYRGDEKPIPPPDKKEKTSVRDQKQREREEKQRHVQEERQKEIERRQKDREKRMKERYEKEEKNKPKPVREWDKDKKSREDWDRTLQKSRSRSPREHRGHRSGSPAQEGRRERSSDRSRDRMGRRDKKKVSEKKDDEPPAKLLDDLFKKTKTTPCIYWLPLTEVQISERDKMGIVRPQQRQKQKGDRVSPFEEIPEADRPVTRKRQNFSPVRARKPSQERLGERPRGRRSTPERRRRENSPDPRSRSGGRRR